MPPFKLKQMQEQMSQDSANPVWQRLQWEALRKSINGLVNKVCHAVLYTHLFLPNFRVFSLEFLWHTLMKNASDLRRHLHSNLQINTGNITNLVPEFFAENLIAGRGLLCRSIMKAQLASANFSHVYAAVISVINTKMPEIGELLLKRLVSQFRRAYKRNDKVRMPLCTCVRIWMAEVFKKYRPSARAAISLPFLFGVVCLLCAGTGIGVR